MFTAVDFIVFGFGVLVLTLWVGLYIKGYQHTALFVPLTEKEYPLKEIYFVGYAFTQAIQYTYKSKQDRTLRKQLSILYGEQYADYYIRVVYAQKITMTLTIAVLAFVFYGLTGDLAVFFIILSFSGLAYYGFGMTVQKKIIKRSEEMLRDFSEVISKLALLTNAGMILREAWAEIAATGQTALYVEMQKSVNEMNNGSSETEAFFQFGARCIIPEIKKFTSTLVQGFVKGNSELSTLLKEQSKEVWNEKKQHVKRQGEKAAGKLMIPICMMFVGILIMMIVPILANMI